MIGTMLVCK